MMFGACRRMLVRALLFAAGVVVTFFCGPLAAAPVAVTGTMTYTQNFDGLGTAAAAWADDATLPGWYAQINNGATPAGTVRVSDGLVNGLNGLLNLGAANSSDRALGSRAASAGNSANIAYAVQFRNTGTAAVRLQKVTFTGELWRTNSSSNGRPETYTVFYSITPGPVTNILSGGNTTDAVAGAGFATLSTDWIFPPVGLPPPAPQYPPDVPLDGNAAVNRLTVTTSLGASLIIFPGHYLTIKWTDTNLFGNDGYQGVDDVAVEFVSLAGKTGRVDLTFLPQANARGEGLAVQGDGKIVTGDSLNTVQGAARTGVARLNADGSLDAAFNPRANRPTRCIMLLPDEKMVIAGGFTSVGGVERNCMARLNADGTLDAGFNPNADGSVTAGAMQADGKMVFYGGFTTVGGQPRTRLARLFPNGTTDPVFTAGTDGLIRSIAIQTDGRMVLSGEFQMLGGLPRQRIGRLDGNGVIDDTGFYNPAARYAYCVAVQPDDKVLAGGGYSLLIGGTGRDVSGALRLLANGNPDEDYFFGTHGAGVYSMALQADGKIIMAGDVSANGSSVVMRLHPDGSVDSNFQPVFEGHAEAVALQADGKVIVSGRFTAVDGQPRNSMARLDNDPATQTLTVSLAGIIQWLRGGSSPEVQRVTFELGTEEGTGWTPLGEGTRVPGGWEIMGLALPPGGKIRARGRTVSGYFNASAGFVETIVPFGTTARERWRLLHFGSMENTGNGADLADPDLDGLENLVEFAFGRNPQTPDAAELPAWELDDDTWVLSFPRPATVAGVTYVAEYSSSLAAGSWQRAPNAGTGSQFVFFKPAVENRLYLRMRVTAP